MYNRKMKNLGFLLFFCFIAIFINPIYGSTISPPEIQGCEADSFNFDSLNIRFIGNWPFGRPNHVEYDSLRKLVFLSSGGGVCILDVSDPSNPVKLSENIHSREFIYNDIFYDYNTHRLYIAVGRWFEIWDVSNPDIPYKLGYFAILLPSYSVDGDIYVSGSYAYCVNFSSFSIVDISSPSNPQIIGGLPAGGVSVAVKDSFAYIVSPEPKGFHVIDISDPQNPEEVSSLWQKGWDIAIFGSYAYISNIQDLNFRIIDISDPYNPQFAGYFDSPDDVFHAHVIDTIAYLATEYGLRIVNISDPMNAQELGYFYSRGRDIFVMDTIAYLVDRDTGLRVIDVSIPSSTQEVGNYITPGKSFKVVISGSFAYIASENGLWVIDLSDHSIPKEIGRCYTPSEAFDICLSGSYAYVTVSQSGLHVIDISDPASPHEVGFLDLPDWGRNYGLDISGHYCYVALGPYGLRVIDISNPPFPYEVGQCSLHRAVDVEVSGLYAYVIHYGWLTVVDISNPSEPNVVGGYDKLHLPSDICISGMYAFVTDSINAGGPPNGLNVFDISNPSNPQLIAYIYNFHYSGVDVAGMYAYISVSIDAELRIWDVSDPANPLWSGYYASWQPYFEFHDVFARGTYAYLATDCGLQIYQFYGAGVEEELEKYNAVPSAVKLLQNPVRGNSIRLMLTTQNAHNVKLELYNLLGQEVKTFSFNSLSFGENKVELSIDEVPTGVYFLRLKNSPGYKSKKVIIVR